MVKEKKKTGFCQPRFVWQPWVQAPYLDVYGETDQGLKRGNPLTLDPARYQKINRLVTLDPARYQKINRLGTQHLV